MDVAPYVDPGTYKIPLPPPPEDVHLVLNGQVLETALAMANKMSNAALARALNKYHYYITYVVEKPPSLWFSPETGRQVYRILMENAAATGNPLLVTRLQEFIDGSLSARKKGQI